MALSYKISIKDGMFKYNCTDYNSFIKIRRKDIKKIYEILNRLKSINIKDLTTGVYDIAYGDFTIVFNFNGDVRIKNISNWLSTMEEVPIIIKELSKYIEICNTETIKDIIVKIKSLKKGE